MKFGAHVSSAGGISNAIGRGQAIGCESLQVFTHNPRTWKPINHTPEQIAAFRDLAADAGIAPLVSHGLYLMNLGARDEEVPTGPPAKAKMRNIHRSSVESLTQHLQIGEALGLDGVVLHVGSHKGDTLENAVARIGSGIGEALDASPGSCAIYLENTAGGGETIGRSFEQLRAVADAAGHEDRVGFCLDTQHLFASGFPIHEEGGIDRVLADFDSIVGLDRLKCLHLNDSKTEFGSNRDRHENIGEGLIGEEGFRRILGHPALQGLPVILEVPGEEGDGPDAINIERARRLHTEGLALRA